MILNFLAILLFLLIAVSTINLWVVLFKYGWKWKTVNGYFKSGAIELDKFGNRYYRSLWNAVFRTKQGYEFGKPNETISSALGKNQQTKTLTWFGWVFVYILFAIDYKNWKNGGHCIASINDNPLK